MVKNRINMKNVDEYTEDDPYGCDYYSNDIKRIPLLTPNEEAELSKKIQSGDKAAVSQLVDANYRLVLKISREYYVSEEDRKDLIQAGNMGLIYAAEKYDYKKGRFSTYATYWIKAEMNKVCDSMGYAMHIPQNILTDIKKINRTRDYLTEKYGYEAEHEDIAMELNIPVEKILEIERLSKPVQSLDAPLNEDNFTIGDTVEYEDTGLIEKNLVSFELNIRIQELLGKLEGKERDIIELRYGFKDEKVWRYEDIAKEYKVTRACIHEIEVRALNKLKKIAEKDELKAFLE